MAFLHKIYGWSGWWYVLQRQPNLTPAVSIHSLFLSVQMANLLITKAIFLRQEFSGFWELPQPPQMSWGFQKEWFVDMLQMFVSHRITGWHIRLFPHPRFRAYVSAILALKREFGNNLMCHPLLKDNFCLDGNRNLGTTWCVHLYISKKCRQGGRGSSNP